LKIGKTSLIKRYIDNVFPEKVPYQSEETFVKTILHKKEEVKLILLDTVGQNEYTPFLQSKYCIGVHAYILIFAINDENSFEAIQHINKLVLESVGCKYVPRIIIGNKSDLDTLRYLVTYLGK
jgi:GTPase SAR1 family protein